MIPVKKRGPGRPTKRTAEVEGRILVSLRDGLDFDAATAMGGISASTLVEWMRQDPNLARRVASAVSAARIARPRFKPAEIGHSIAMIANANLQGTISEALATHLLAPVAEAADQCVNESRDALVQTLERAFSMGPEKRRVFLRSVVDRLCTSAAAIAATV